MKLLATVFIIIVSISISLAQRTCLVQGQIFGLNTGKVYLHSTGLLGQGSQLVDSVNLSGQFFSFRRPVDEPKWYFLSIDDTFGQFYFVWDKDLFISLSGDDLNLSSIEESPVNEALKSFSDTVATVYDQRFKLIRQMLSQAQEDSDTSKVRQLYEAHFMLSNDHAKAVRSFIEKNRQEWVSLFVLTSYHKDLGRHLTLDLLAMMNPTFQKSQLAIQLKKTISDSDYPIIWTCNKTLDKSLSDIL